MRKSEKATQQPEAMIMKYAWQTVPVEDQKSLKGMETGILDAETTLCRRDCVIHEHWLPTLGYVEQSLHMSLHRDVGHAHRRLYRGVFCRDLKLSCNNTCVPQTRNTSLY